MTVPTLDTPFYDHVSLGVADLGRAAAFWDGALAALGWVRLWTQARAIGYGPEGFEGESPLALIEHGEDAAPPGPGFHIALIAADRSAVSAFYEAALEGGGLDEGPPGVRENYDPGYFAAFVRDPDGHRVEAVVHEVAPQSDDVEDVENISDDLRELVVAARNAPDDVDSQMAAAYACDRAGHERLAIEFYDAAWQIGVPENSQRVFVVSYASTLRNVGRTDESSQVFETHIRDFPDDLEARCFYALNSLTGGSLDSAVAELLDVILTLKGGEAGAGFWPALASYRDELDAPLDD